MRDSVPSARYSPVCNVLRQWKTSLIPTYRVYRLYDTTTEYCCASCKQIRKAARRALGITALDYMCVGMSQREYCYCMYTLHIVLYKHIPARPSEGPNRSRWGASERTSLLRQFSSNQLDDLPPRRLHKDSSRG